MNHHLEDWDNDESVEIPADLPQPFLWRLIVMPIKPKTMSKGGIMLAQQVQDAEQHLAYIGKVLAIGDLAFKSERFAGQSAFPAVGDWIGYGKYAGQPMMFRGLRLITLNDDLVLFRVSDPDGFRIYV